MGEGRKEGKKVCMGKRERKRWDHFLLVISFKKKHYFFFNFVMSSRAVSFIFSSYYTFRVILKTS